MLHALTGVVVAHFFHLLSTLVLYALVLHVIPDRFERRDSVAFVTACLHIISPAGLFLSAPYAESLFACLNFLGMLFYSMVWYPRIPQQLTVTSSSLSILSGACFGLASTARGNGILSALVYVEPALEVLGRLVYDPLNLETLARFFALGITGLFILGGTILPQYIAYLRYCINDIPGNVRPWCSHLPPSIFTWVQSEYW